MIGFSERVVILLPQPEIYEESYSVYKSSLNKSISTVREFASKNEMDLAFISTNELSSLFYNKDSDILLQTITPEDLFFLKSNIPDFYNILEGITYEDLYSEIRKQFPVKRGLDIEERYDLIFKRDRELSKRILNKEKFIISFEAQSKAYYKIKSNTNDGRLILRVKGKGDFSMSAYMSGDEISPSLLFNNPTMSSPVVDWRF